MWDLVVKWLVPFLCGGIMTFATTTLMRSHALKDGLQCLLRAELIRSYEKYKQHGYCAVYAKESMTRAYKAYHALGGNDVVTELYHDTMALPTEPDHGSQSGFQK